MPIAHIQEEICKGNEDQPGAMVKPRFHERTGISREMMETHHRQLLKLGWIDAPEIEGEFFREVLREFGISQVPKSGWTALAYELRLINLIMPDTIDENMKGAAKISSDCEELATQLDKIAEQVIALTHHTEVSVSLYSLKFDIAEGVPKMFETARNLEVLARHLKPTKPSGKWKATERRRQRIELACELSGLFEGEFGQPAKPVGGSASLELEYTNDWTRFFQAIASVFLNEQATPDRQAILWEAASST